MEKTVKEAPVKEVTPEEINEIILSMTTANWIVLRNGLDMSREEIMEDSGLLMLLVAWKKSGTNVTNLSRLLEATERELYAEVGIDLDKALAEATADAKKDAKKK